MIVTQTVTINNREFVRTFSDAGLMIERDGNRYEEALDPAELGRVYSETDEPITREYPSEVEEKAAAYDILMGVSR